ncbi:hypothetical protein BGZ63DRAFT_153302 [Mariannaea sp. PMI_226]|nr:hypothetical protein BGZ63DRAFT_153302 [Mariannaea sp. PMI_226]
MRNGSEGGRGSKSQAPGILWDRCCTKQRDSAPLPPPETTAWGGLSLQDDRYMVSHLRLVIVGWNDRSTVRCVCIVLVNTGLQSITLLYSALAAVSFIHPLTLLVLRSVTSRLPLPSIKLSSIVAKLRIFLSSQISPNLSSTKDPSSLSSIVISFFFFFLRRGKEKNTELCLVN